MKGVVHGKERVDHEVSKEIICEMLRISLKVAEIVENRLLNAGAGRVEHEDQGNSTLLSWRKGNGLGNGN